MQDLTWPQEEWNDAPSLAKKVSNLEKIIKSYSIRQTMPLWLDQKQEDRNCLDREEIGLRQYELNCLLGNGIEPSLWRFVSKLEETNREQREHIKKSLGLEFF